MGKIMRKDCWVVPGGEVYWDKGDAMIVGLAQMVRALSMTIGDLDRYMQNTVTPRDVYATMYSKGTASTRDAILAHIYDFFAKIERKEEEAKKALEELSEYEAIPF
jgi:hypothetical protein